MMSETRFAMVSVWMANGNINEFIKAHPNADRLGLVGPPLATLPPSILELGDSLAGGRRRGTDIPSRKWNDTRRYQRGMRLRLL